MNELFPILAVETSGELCSVALLLDEKNFVELNYFQKQIHSKKLIDMIDTVIKISGTELCSIKSLAVSMGPGSFTGLRIGLSTVKGIAFGANLGIVPVPTFDAFALQTGKHLADKTIFTIAISANIEELYFARFIKKNNQIEVVDELRLIEKKELENLVDTGEVIFGNIALPENVDRVSSPTAKAIGEWAYLFGKDLLTYDRDYLEPNYFKKFIVKDRR